MAAKGLPVNSNRLLVASLFASLASLASLTACAVDTSDGGTGSQTSQTSSGSKLPTPKTLSNAPFLTDLQVDSSSVYWTDNSGNAWSMPRSGGTSTQLASTNVADDFPSFASDGTNLYIANDTAISSVPDQGGTLSALATAPGPTSSLTLHDGILYWASSFTDPTQTSSAVIASMPVGGGAITTLASSLSAPGYVVADDDNVYFGDIGTGTINVVSQQGGSVTVLASNQGGIGGLAVDDGVVYWSNYNGPAAGIVGEAPPQPSEGDGTVNAVSSDGTSTWVVATGYQITSGIAVSGSYLYWSDGFKNTISRTSLDGSETKVLADDTLEVGPVANGDSLFYGVALPPPQNVFQIHSIAK
jgi:hypothetical protein